MKVDSNVLLPMSEEEFKQIFATKNEVKSEEVDPLVIFGNCIDQMPKLAIGPYFWFIADSLNWVVYAAGGMINQTVGINFNDIVGKAPDALFNKVLPNDLMKMFAFSKFWISYYVGLPLEKRVSAKATIYMRILDENKNLKWIMCQYPDQIISDEGFPIYGLMMMTDISHLKYEGQPMLSILNSFDETCQIFYCSDSNDIIPEGLINHKITTRETEVLINLTKGLSSKQIADSLNISINTVSNHRQNMLVKTGSKSTAELVNYAVRMGLV